MDTPSSPASVGSTEAGHSENFTPSKTKIFGVERRLIGFGFALFLMLVVLAVMYQLYTSAPMLPSSVGPTTPVPLTEKTGTSSQANQVVTPETVADDLIDEALSDRDDFSGYDNDERADVEDGSNN